MSLAKYKFVYQEHTAHRARNSVTHHNLFLSENVSKSPSLPLQPTKRQICSLHISLSNLHTPQAETGEWKCLFRMLSLQVRALLSSSSLSNHLENFLKGLAWLQTADINSLYFLIIYLFIFLLLRHHHYPFLQWW